GWAFAGSMAQLPSSEPDSVYLNTFWLPSTTQNDVPSVTMSWGLALPFFPLTRLKLLAAIWLPERRLTAPVYLETLPPELSTSQMSLPLVAMPVSVAEEFRPPADQEPSRAPPGL